MTTREIIQQYLKANNYDGLVNDHSCGCDIDHLALCESLNLDECVPAYKYTCKPDEGKCGAAEPVCLGWGHEVDEKKDCYREERLTGKQEGKE